MKTPSHLIRGVLMIVGLGIAAPAFVGCSSTSTRESTGEYIDDSVITAKVKTALARDDQVNGFAVSVETFRGVVQLSGFVDTEQEKQVAGQVARGVSGVIDVRNNISLKPAPSERTAEGADRMNNNNRSDVGPSAPNHPGPNNAR